MPHLKFNPLNELRCRAVFVIVFQCYVFMRVEARSQCCTTLWKRFRNELKLGYQKALKYRNELFTTARH